MSIIAGPIVRQSDRRHLSLWLVANKATQFDIKLYDQDRDGQLINSQLHPVRELKLAQHCYVYMLRCEFDLDNGKDLVFYDLLVDSKPLQGSTLQKQICFSGQQLPSVRLPKQHQHILQASCRKPHAKGPKDALAMAANFTAKRIHSTERPSLLMFTGDQIYADDVSPITLDYLMRLAQEFGFAKEQFKDAQTLDDIKLDERGKHLTLDEGFSSDAKDSHLMSFAEYFLMYLLSFGGLLAAKDDESSPLSLARYAQLKPKLSRKKKSIKGRSKVVYSARSYKQDYQRLRRFLCGAQAVRKLLANTVTYMMFDDHDVTDDWNLSLENQHNFSSSAAGQQLGVNALASYMLVQHWGNQAQFEPPELAHIEALAQQPLASKREPLLPLLSKDWGYIVAQQPPLIALDTRTGRHFHGDNLEKTALMNAERLAQLQDKLTQLDACPTALVISPTPMFGFSRLEAIQLGMRAMSSKFDREAWITDEQALASLQQSLAQQPGVQDVMILSGDVHYAFARRQTLSESGMMFWQLCSSASNNRPVGGSLGLGFLRKLPHYFFKERTRYLKTTNKEVLSSDKNVGLLSLDDNLKPLSADLLCRKHASGKADQKHYDLRDPDIELI